MIENDHRGSVSMARARTQPLVTIELLIAERTDHCELHIRVGNTTLEPVRLVFPVNKHTDSHQSSEDSCPVDDFVNDIRQRLERHGCNTGTTRRWIIRDRQLRDIGLRLGGFLFGCDDPRKRRQHGNALYSTLLQFYRDADKENSFISLCFHATNPRLDSLPWELAIWPFGGRDIILGTDHHLTFVRQGYYPEYFRPDFTPPERNSLHIQQFTSAHDSSCDLSPAHRAITAFFEDLDLDANKLDELAQYSHEWQQPRSCDIFHFFGHGDAGRLYWGAKDQEGSNGGDYEFDVKQLMQQIGGEHLPSLVVLMACSSFDAQGWKRRGLLWDLLQHGVAAVIGLQGKARISVASHFIQALYLQLASHGRIDLAIQRVRELMRRNERSTTSIYQSDILRADWFRPVLGIRDATVLSLFEGLRANQLDHDEPLQEPL